MKILIVEDDQLTAAALKTLLTDQNYAVEWTTDGQEAEDLLEAFNYDLILSDVVLPGRDGISLCRELRSQGHTTPILLLTGRDSGHDKAMGLDAGADDYVVKPFDPEELIARIRALLRRGEIAKLPILTWGDLQLDPQSCEATYQAHQLTLTPKEYALLELFLSNHRRVFSCGMILEHLWAYEDTPGEEAVRTHIKGLRQKLKAAGAPADTIETIYGIGYRLKPLPKPPQPSSPTDATPQSQQQTLKTLGDLWLKFQPHINQQVAQLEAAALDRQDGPLADDHRQQVQREAHNLAGGLGTFGLMEASHLARRIEQLLELDPTIDSDQIQQLQQDVAALRCAITPASEQQHTARQTPLQNPLITSQEDPMEGHHLLEATVMMVDDDPQILATVTALLQPWGIRMIALSQPLQIWQTLTENQPDLLILDVNMPQVTGIELCHSLRAAPQWEQLPIIFLTVYTEPDIINQVYAAGADDFVSKPIVGPELVVRILNRLERTRLQRRLIPEHNPVNRVLAHGQAATLLGSILAEVEDHQRSLCLGVLEVEHLPEINHCFGYAVGNDILRQVAVQLIQAVPQADGIARRNGAQFVVGLQMSKKQAETWLLAQVKILQDMPLLMADGTAVPIACSIGIAQYPIDGATLPALYGVADVSLLQFKLMGRLRSSPQESLGKCE